MYDMFSLLFLFSLLAELLTQISRAQQRTERLRFSGQYIPSCIDGRPATSFQLVIGRVALYCNRVQSLGSAGFTSRYVGGNATNFRAIPRCVTRLAFDQQTFMN